jgi:hypothetical protein
MIARAELRRRWRALVALGVLAGTVGAVVVGTGVVGRRTSTAYARLTRASRAPDVTVIDAGGRGVADRSLALPEVRAAWVGQAFVGRLEGRLSDRPASLHYLAVVAGPPPRPDEFRPLVARGRPYRSTSRDEVVVTESFARDARVRIGDRLPLKLLTTQEVGQFDTGFGEPDGPRLTLRITGIARVVGGPDVLPNVFGSPALARSMTPEVTAFRFAFVSLRAGASTRGFTEGVTRLDQSTARNPAFEEFAAQVVELSQTRRAVDATRGALVFGLAVFAGLIGLAGLLALVQSFLRHFAAGAEDQRIEAALGLGPWERATARALAALLAVGVAVAVTVAGALAAARIEPLSSLQRYEPHPGTAVNVALTALGALAVAVITLLVVLLTARQVPRRARSRPSALAQQATALGASPPVAVGMRLALEPGRGRTSVPVRTALAGAVVGIAGVVAAATVAVNLERLATTPSRWGWNADFGIADVKPPLLERLRSDTRVAALTVLVGAPVQLQGRQVPAYAEAREKGALGWTLLAGHSPARADEVTVGARAASESGVGPGDSITLVAPRRPAAVRFEVVGIGLGPTISAQALGSDVLLTGAGLARVQQSEPTREALVRARTGAEADALRAELAPEVEFVERIRPPEIENLAQLDRLPGLLGVCIGVLAAVALAHALVVAVRRRGRDLAVLRAVGFTSAQSAGAVATMAATTAAVGLVIGLPAGVVGGRVLWRTIARTVHVGADVALPALAIGVIVPAAIAGAIAIAAVPARRAARLSPAVLLRTE